MESEIPDTFLSSSTLAFFMAVTVLKCRRSDFARDGPTPGISVNVLESAEALCFCL